MCDVLLRSTRSGLYCTRTITSLGRRRINSETELFLAYSITQRRETGGNREGEGGKETEREKSPEEKLREPGKAHLLDE